MGIFCIVHTTSGTLVQGKDGNFYVTTARAGTIFKITPGGILTTLAGVGGFPYAGLVQATDGNFYGTTYVGGNYGYGSVFGVTPAGTLTTLYSFCPQPNCSDGYDPIAGLIFKPLTASSTAQHLAEAPTSSLELVVLA